MNPAFHFELLQFCYDYEFTLKFKTDRATRMVARLLNGYIYEVHTFSFWCGKTDFEVHYISLALNKQTQQLTTQFLQKPNLKKTKTKTSRRDDSDDD